MNKIHVVLTWFWMALFVLFAAVQYNDPDPWLWIWIYLGAAFMGFAALRGWFQTFLYPVVAAGFMIFALYQWPEKWEGIGEKMLNENTERAREALGLLICALVVLYFYLVRLQRKNHMNQTNGNEHG